MELGGLILINRLVYKGTLQYNMTMYEGLQNLLELKGMGLTRDPNSNMPKAYTIRNLIPMVAAQAMPNQRTAPMPMQQAAMPMRPAPMPPQMSQPVLRAEGGSLTEGGSVAGNDYVVDAYTVAALGNGSSEAGGERLQAALPKASNTDGSFSGMVDAPNGDGMSDNVSYEVQEGGDITEARISKDEYIIDENQVKEIGGGDAGKGAERLDKLREEIRQQAYGTTKQPKQISASKTLREFMKEVQLWDF